MDSLDGPEHPELAKLSDLQLVNRLRTKWGVDAGQVRREGGQAGSLEVQFLEGAARADHYLNPRTTTTTSNDDAKCICVQICARLAWADRGFISCRNWFPRHANKFHMLCETRYEQQLV